MHQQRGEGNDVNEGMPRPNECMPAVSPAKLQWFNWFKLDHRCGCGWLYRVN